ncbi:MAG: hypothetical protein BWY74_03022 [Firmicutes bacterium ADurb.Bin419]|nr:MAG: hypothetical protein BWY74_03022 [Firmicutes bacterium ADurb.Bin419]
MKPGNRLKCNGANSYRIYVLTDKERVNVLFLLNEVFLFL